MGEAVGDAFGHGDEVGTDVQPLVGEEFPAAAVAALYLVADEYGAMLLAGLTQALGKIFFHQTDATYALDAFEYTGAHVALGQLFFPSAEVVKGKVGDMVVGIHRGDDLGVVGGFNGE